MLAAAILFTAGLALGAYRAHRRGGTSADMVQYGLAHAIPAGIVGLVASVLLIQAGV